jgi:DNA-binding NarL/FixJ family response regulator
VSPILSPAESVLPVAARARITALIADDEPHVRAYLRLVLRSLGVTTMWEAGDGVEALRVYEDQAPSVVLLDVNMPMLTGEGVIHALAQRFPEAAVVVVTSQSEHETVKRFAELGAIGYVLKQQPREVVTKMIAEALDLLDLDSTE